MNKSEVATVLQMITTHYWQVPGVAERDIDLMVNTWTMVFQDMPLRPHIESALAWWFANEKWPPQASELRERAKLFEKGAERKREQEALLARYAPLPAGERKPLPSLEERRAMLAELLAQRGAS